MPNLGVVHVSQTRGGSLFYETDGYWGEVFFH